jgi:hypothetical protein
MDGIVLLPNEADLSHEDLLVIQAALQIHSKQAQEALFKINHLIKTGEVSWGKEDK